jgi:hypothetical protein
MVPLAQRYYETLRLPAFRFAALRYLRLAIPSIASLVSSPAAQDTRLRDQPGVGKPESRPAMFDGDGRVSQSSRGTLVIIRHVLRPRRDPACSMGPSGRCRTRPPRLTKTRAHHNEISGLNRTAFDRAVYASQWRLPATTQDSLPAAGPALPDGIGYPQGSDERFRACGCPPLPSFLAQGQTVYLVCTSVHTKYTV